ncbi:MAG: DUF5011 domain-containing protein, partial [Nitrosopumilus sp.]|nr:DUF5011 domain-containing protein [Nitrosopumilus sp.]
VDDYTPPVLVVHGPLEQSIQKNGPWHDMGSTCTDVTDGVIEVRPEGVVNPAVGGFYTLTYTCADASGKSVSQNRTVTVSDSDAPAIYLRGLASLEVSQNSVYEDPGAYCIDAVDGRSEAVRPLRPLDTSVLGEFELVYTCTDDDGMSSTATRTVTVVENAEPPEAFRRGGATTYHVVGTTYNDKGAYCIDGTDGRFEAAAEDVPTGLDTGRFRVSYTCTDSGGLTDTTSRIVNVEESVDADTERPAIMIRGGERVDHPIGTYYHERGAVCTDTVNGVIDEVGVSGSVNSSVADVYVITYTCEDESGNEGSAEKTVTVQDVPVLEVREGNRILAQNTTYADRGATCTSFAAEPLLVTDNPVDTTRPANYTITYECTVEGTFATSGVGYTNTATGSRWVLVSDDTAPRMALRGGASVGVASGGTYVEQGASCVDREEGHLPVYLRYVTPQLGSTPGVRTDAAYRYTATYTCADKSGNDASAERSISVGGDAPSGSAAAGDGPGAELAGAPRAILSVSQAYDDPGAECGDGTAPAVSTSHNSSRLGTYTTVYSCGEAPGASVVLRTIVVAPGIEPVIVLRGSEITRAPFMSDYVDAGADCIDEKDPRRDATADVMVDTDSPGSYSVVYTCTDSDGRPAEPVTRTVLVEPRVPISLRVPKTSSCDDWVATSGSHSVSASGHLQVGAIVPDVASIGRLSYIEVSAGLDPTAVAIYDYDVSGRTIRGAISPADAAYIGFVPPGTSVHIKGVYGSASTFFTDDTGLPPLKHITHPGIGFSNYTAFASFVGPTVLMPGGVFTVADRDGDGAEDITALHQGIVSTELCHGWTASQQAAGAEISITGDNPAVHRLGTPYIDAGATCDAGNVEAAHVSNVNASRPGTYSVTYSCTTVGGIPAPNATRTVDVRDLDGPLVVLNGAARVQHMPNQYEELGATCMDEHEGDLGNAAIDAAGLDDSVTGLYHVLYSCSDSADNNSTRAREVHVTDEFSTPEITINGFERVLVGIGASYVDLGARCYDPFEGVLPVSPRGAADTTSPGLEQITYTCENSAGVGTSAVRNVTVSDDVPDRPGTPSLELNGASTALARQYHTYDDAGATCTDPEDGRIGHVGVSLQRVDNGVRQEAIPYGVVDTTSVARYVITYTCVDSDGNPADIERTVHVTASLDRSDDDPALLVQGEHGLVGEFAVYEDAGALCTGPGGVFNATATGVPGPEDIGAHVIWYSCLESGVPQDSRTVVLFDTTGPRVELIGPERFLLGTGSTRDVPGALCHDGSTVKNATVEHMLNKDVPGTYPHRYICTDDLENVSHANRTVVVVDDEKPPVLELRGLAEMYIQKGLDFIEPGHSCIDEVDGVLPVDVEPPDTSVGGIRSVVYTCTDFAGNAAEAERLVIVADDMDKPVLELNGSPRVSVVLGEEYNELGAMCRDLFDGVLDVEISPAVDTNKRGVYNVTYSCEDSAGNEAVKMRAVAVAPLTGIGADRTSGVLALPWHSTNAESRCGSTAQATIAEEYRSDGLHITHRNPGLLNTPLVSHFEVLATSTNRALSIYGHTPVFDGNNLLIPYTVLSNITADPEYEQYKITGVTQRGVLDTGQSFFRTVVPVISHPDMTADLARASAHAKSGEFYLYIVNSDGETLYSISGGVLTPDTRTLNSYSTCVSGVRFTELEPDTTNPELDPVGPRRILHKFGTEIVDPGITCTDNRDPDPKITTRILDTNANPIDDLNTHTPSIDSPNFVYYTCTDASGNDAFYSREYAVLKENQDAYLITMEGPPIDSVPLGTEYVDPGAVCRNAVRGTTAAYTPESFVDTSEEGRYHIHYTCQDDLAFVLRDGSRIAGFAIRIVDVQLAPVPHVISAEPVAEACPAPISLEPGISAEDGHVMIDLGEAGLPSLISYVEVSADGGRTIAIYNYTLSDGRVSIHLHPTTAAAIAVNPQSAAYNVKTIYHTDVVGDIETARLTPVKVIADDTISPEAYGTFSSFVGRTALAFNDTTLVEPGEAPDPTVRLTGLEAKCAKASGRAALDADPPVMVGLPDDRIIVRGTDYTMPMVECRDIIEGVFEAVPDGTVDVDTLGIYPITYTCRDSDNTVSATRTVTVIEKDDTKPVIQRRGGSVSYHVTGTIYEDPGAICTDIVDGAFNATAKIPADITGAGTHTVIYTCTDVSGNESVRNRTVITQGSLPVDAAPPALAVVPPSIMAVSVDAPFTDPGITCNDETNKIIDIPQVTGEVDTRTAGQYTLQYDCVDESGNLASQNPFTPRIRTVIVTEEVVLTLNGTLDDVAEFGQPYAEPGYTCRDVDGSEITDIERVPAVLDTRILGEQVL